MILQSFPFFGIYGEMDNSYKRDQNNKYTITEETVEEISYELGTAVNGIIGLASIAETKLEEPEQVKGCLHQINSLAAGLVETLNRMLIEVRQENSMRLDMKTVLSDVDKVLNQLEKPEETIVEGSAFCCDKHFLVVEDNEISREVETQMLEFLGGTVRQACNGREAVNILRESEQNEYDMVFMDIQMPEMDGYTATREIRELDREDLKSLPVIGLSANTFAKDEQLAKEVGMNAFVSKHMTMAQLRKFLSEWM